MRLEFKQNTSVPVEEILSSLARALQREGITHLQYFNSYCLKGFEKHIKLNIAKCDKQPHDFSKDDDSGNSIVENF